jgi:GT2 family glycosyltransferase
LIIPTRDRLEILQPCIESIRNKSTYPNYEIIIVDNGSTDPEILSWFTRGQRAGELRVFRVDGEFNFSLLNNRAVHEATGSIVGLVNNDIEVVSPDWLEEMVSYASRPDIGAVGAKLLYADGTIQHAGVTLGIGSIAGHLYKHCPNLENTKFGHLAVPREYSAVTAACLLVDRNKYLEVGGLNEQDLRVAFNDIDFCLKLRRQGYRNVHTPFATLYHHESKSRGKEDSPEKVRRFQGEIQYMLDHWGNELLHDPYYSPNLSLDDETSQAAWPPRHDVVRNR